MILSFLHYGVRKRIFRSYNRGKLNNSTPWRPWGRLEACPTGAKAWSYLGNFADTMDREPSTPLRCPILGPPTQMGAFHRD
jgi:hypothetical protein